MGPDNTISVRAVRQDACPQIVIDGSSGDMAVRATPTEQHPNVVCETLIPHESIDISIDGTVLPMPVADPQRITVIGDTGCRLLEPDIYQDCNDPADWPFATTAMVATDWNPDLVVHVGDYVYRQSPCPAGNTGCAGSPFGENWDTWNADFFTPAKSLLEAAPWIMVRGNHEDCNRSGEGWFRYLDAGPIPQTCQTYTQPWALTIGDVQAVVLDVAAAQDTHADAEITAAFAPILDQVITLAGDGPAWLLTHRAFWSIGVGGDGQPTMWSTATYDETGFADHTNTFDLVLAGHVHMAQLLSSTPDSGRTPELIAGSAGTKLDDMATGRFDGAALGVPELVEGWRWQDFGFVTIERVDNGFVTDVHLLDGTSSATCLLVGGQLACLVHEVFDLD